MAPRCGEPVPNREAIYNVRGMTGLPNIENLRSARTARTYPVSVKALVSAFEEAIRGLPRWELALSCGEEVRAVRRTRAGSRDDVTVRLAPLESGDHTNTHARFESASRIGGWDLGQNRRNLNELLRAVDESLISKAS